MTGYTSIPSGIPINYLHAIDGYIYGYDNISRKIDSITNMYNPDNQNRMDQYGNIVSLYQEIDKKLSNSTPKYMIFLGYNYDPSIIMLVSQLVLTDEQQELFNATIHNHENNVADKYGIKHNGTLIMNPEQQDMALLFDTQEQAQQGIIVMGLPTEDCEIIPIVVL
jgi:hypothetical protein